MSRRRWFVCVPLLLAAGCPAPTRSAPVAPPAPVAPAPVAPAPPTLADVEAALLAAPAWRAEVAIHASGAFAADLDAVVIATADNRVRVEARGSFAGQPVDLLWKSDGARTTTGVATPPHTTEAIVLGMTRMGLLHNLATLIRGGLVPDHAEGGAGDWVRAIAPHPAGGGRVAFGLEVDGQPAADVELGLAAGADGPVMTTRAITVHFDGGEMAVEERYRFDLAYELPSDAFVTGGGP